MSLLEIRRLVSEEATAAAAGIDTALFTVPVPLRTAPSNEIGAHFRVAYAFYRASRMMDEDSALPSPVAQRVYYAAQLEQAQADGMALQRLTPQGQMIDAGKVKTPQAIAAYLAEQSAYLRRFDWAVALPAAEYLQRLADPAAIAAAQRAAGEAPGAQGPLERVGKEAAKTAAPWLAIAAVLGAAVLIRGTR